MGAALNSPAPPVQVMMARHMLACSATAASSRVIDAFGSEGLLEGS